MKLLNLGCGNRWHPDWENVDFFSTSPGVRAHNLRHGIPYPDGTFDVVYHSHVLEHFSKKDAISLLRECHRATRVGGTIRVVVPDLEQVARLYLSSLENAKKGVPGWRDNYDWMVLEMFDQAVRERPGGEWYEYLRRSPIPNWDFVRQRAGAEAESALSVARATEISTTSGPNHVRARWGFILRNPAKVIQNKLARMILGRQDFESLQIGRFRRQGEIHQWMYDGYSLGRLLEENGFSNPRRCEPSDSQVPGWAQYHLDTEPDGTPYRPSSLYMEATKT